MKHRTLTITTLIVTLAASAAADTLADLIDQGERIDLAASKMAQRERTLDREASDLAGAARQLETQAAVLTAEIDRFVDFRRAVDVMVDSWNQECAGEQEEAKYDWCMRKRAEIEPEVTRRDGWASDLMGRAQAHDRAAEANRKATAANQAETAELAAGKQQLRALQEDWQQRAAAWRATAARAAAARMCERIPDREPERKQACLSAFFDGSNPALRECLDMPARTGAQLQAFRACLDRKVADRR